MRPVVNFTKEDELVSTPRTISNQEKCDALTHCLRIKLRMEAQRGDVGFGLLDGVEECRSPSNVNGMAIDLQADEFADGC